MVKQLSNIRLEVSCIGNGQAVYYLGPGRTSGPFVLKGGSEILHVQRSWLDVLSSFTARDRPLGLYCTNKKPPAELPGAYRGGRQKSYIYFLPITDNNTTLWEVKAF